MGLGVQFQIIFLRPLITSGPGTHCVTVGLKTLKYFSETLGYFLLQELSLEKASLVHSMEHEKFVQKSHNI